MRNSPAGDRPPAPRPRRRYPASSAWGLGQMPGSGKTKVLTDPGENAADAGGHARPGGGIPLPHLQPKRRRRRYMSIRIFRQRLSADWVSLDDAAPSPRGSRRSTARRRTRAGLRRRPQAVSGPRCRGQEPGGLKNNEDDPRLLREPLASATIAPFEARLMPASLVVLRPDDHANEPDCRPCQEGPSSAATHCARRNSATRTGRRPSPRSTPTPPGNRLDGLLRGHARAQGRARRRREPAGAGGGGGAGCRNARAPRRRSSASGSRNRKTRGRPVAARHDGGQPITRTAERAALGPSPSGATGSVSNERQAGRRLPGRRMAEARDDTGPAMGPYLVLFLHTERPSRRRMAGRPSPPKASGRRRQGAARARSATHRARVQLDERPPRRRPRWPRHAGAVRAHPGADLLIRVEAEKRSALGALRPSTILIAAHCSRCCARRRGRPLAALIKLEIAASITSSSTRRRTTNPEQWEVLRHITAEFQRRRRRRGRARAHDLSPSATRSSRSTRSRGRTRAASRRAAAIGASWRATAAYPFEEVPLVASFRSAPIVLRAVDTVFGVPAHFPRPRSVGRGDGHGARERAAGRARPRRALALRTAEPRRRARRLDPPPSTRSRRARPPSWSRGGSRGRSRPGPPRGTPAGACAARATC